VYKSLNILKLHDIYKLELAKLMHKFHHEMLPTSFKDLFQKTELYRSVTTNRELSNTAKLSVFKSIFVPILTYGHESRIMTEIILSQVQAPKIGLLRRVHGVTKGRTQVRLRKKQVWRLHI